MTEAEGDEGADDSPSELLSKPAGRIVFFRIAGNHQIDASLWSSGAVSALCDYKWLAADRGTGIVGTKSNGGSHGTN